MGVELADYQLEAVKELRTGSILCGGVGSGKSRTALSYYLFEACKGHVSLNGDGIFKKMENPKDLYIITTAKKRDSLEWDLECSPFMLTDKPERNISGVKVTIDSWNNIGKYCNVCGAFFIFDEQRIKGSGSWVKSFLQIAKKNDWILLSATPGDTWLDYIPVFVANGFYKNRTEFLRTHVVFNRFAKFPKVDRYVGIPQLTRNRDRVLVLMGYKREIKSNTVYLNASVDQNIYDFVRLERKNPQTKMPIKNISELCATLRRVTYSDPSREKLVKEEILKNNKLIIFYNFDYELEILRKVCKDLGVNCAEWNGHKHMPIPKTNKWVYLVNYMSGAEGWECIETDTILFYSLSYSYSMMVQSMGRTDRLNTPFKNLYYIIIQTPGTIDDQILKCLKQKRNFNEKTDFKVS